MSDAIYRLVYYSRNRLEGRGGAMPAQITQILAASQANNAKVGVTGALMFNRGCFAQVLEGSQRAVEATFERIQQDVRHGDVSLLSFGTVVSRGFPNWSMAYVSASDAAHAGFETLSEETGFDPARMSGDRIFEVLHGMVLEEEAAA
jgi:hypothetical protein